MKVLWYGFCGKQHSWSVCAQNICRSLKKKGHIIHMFSTNGTQHIPEDLIENIIGYKEEDDHQKFYGRFPDGDYDMQITYTAMHNWPHYLKFGSKNRFAIWNYDGSHIPKGWAKYHNHCDYVLPSSQYAKDTFLRNQVPEEKLIIIPHGINEEFFNLNSEYKIKTDKKYKFLVNIAQVHKRKNISGLLNAWGKAFNNKDDVVMIAKLNIKHPKFPFEQNWNNLYAEFKRKYKNNAKIIIVSDFLNNISDIYRSCNIGFSMSHVECFHLPSIEMMSLGKITIASNFGGNVDFMNDKNSLLINGSIVRAPLDYQYWSPHLEGEMFNPNINHAVETLQRSVKEYDQLLEKFTPELEKVKQKYTWDNAVDQILTLVK